MSRGACDSFCWVSLNLPCWKAGDEVDRGVFEQDWKTSLLPQNHLGSWSEVQTPGFTPAPEALESFDPLVSLGLVSFLYTDAVSLEASL